MNAQYNNVYYNNQYNSRMSRYIPLLHSIDNAVIVASIVKVIKFTTQSCTKVSDCSIINS